MGQNPVSTGRIAATYIGTVVGAGFASGQEILQFFTVFGLKGLFGLIIATILFIIFGYIIMDLGYSNNFNSYHEIIRYASPSYLSSIIDAIITFFLFGTLTVMIAGSGAMLKQQFNVPNLWGNLFLAVITIVTVCTGINGVINSISITVPFLLSAAIAVLGPLGAKAKNREVIYKGAVLGGLSLGIGAAAIYISLYKYFHIITNIDVSMVFIASHISAVIKTIYIVILMAEVYTTAVGNLFGFSARAANFAGISNKLLIIVITLLALTASQFGFANLVKYMYPVMGYAGFILLISLLYGKVKKKLF